MPRNNAPAASTLRNRNRITNKTRLKIHQGSLDADAAFIPDEDEEKHRLTNLVAGVDAEDANEHHLQEVLSAAHRNNAANNRVAAIKAAQPPPAAFIPTPDSTGVVANYNELYQANRWRDPVTYVCTSQTVEESITNGIANGFTYYMDERDKEWLDKNNEEARGEGTSAQGALSGSGTRTSARSAKAKGKEPEASQPVPISEDEFELVMGVFEKVTHERTEYLHHGLETGMDFPAFSDYQDVFSETLPASTFATYSIPTWVPAPTSLLKIAKVVYPYWKERRIERGGHRIIPSLNGDESDTLNESYVCFRRRESKSVRKTRASQVTSSDKLARLQIEFNYPLEIAKSILNREMMKKEVVQQSQTVWEKRLAFADLKRKFPSLHDKTDEELLVDKERVVKKPETRSILGLKIKTNDSSSQVRHEPVIRPKDRVAAIRDQIETTLERQKAIDNHWEDSVNNPYQTQAVPYACKLFKFVSPPESPSWPSSSSDTTNEDSSTPERNPRAVRMRYGRGGRIHLDRRSIGNRTFTSQLPRSSLFALQEDDSMDVDEEPEDLERRKRLEEQWKFDMDDAPTVGPRGADEQDRVLIDDYDTAFLRHAMTLHTESDHIHLVTDPTLVVAGPDGRPQGVIPYRLGVPPIIMRRDAQGVVRPFQPGIPSQMQMLAMQNNPAMQQQLKKMQPPGVSQQMRISSGGGMRPPSVPVSNLQQQQQAQAQQSAQSQPQPNGVTVPHPTPHPLPVPVPQHSPLNGTNVVSRAAISMPHVEVPKPDMLTTPALANGIVNGTHAPSPQPDANAEVTVNGTPVRPKSQNVTPQQHLALSVPTNGYHLTPMANMSALLNAGGYPVQNGQATNGLSLQQVQNLKSAFANLPAAEMAALNSGRPVPASYLMQQPNVNMLPNAASLNLKLPATRQAQWAAMQRAPGQLPNGMEVQMNGALTNGMVGGSPNLGHAVPVRSPSANGQRTQMRNGVHVNGHSMSPPHHQHSPSPLPNISQSQSPPRVPMTPNMGLSSPSLQQQSVGANQNGF
ncbi:enhancer of polycomb-like-domain-containing protein [Crepidotus variabilis]|uniref:Enhancer of polycomb-like protein n=1 Tax=Crepidotus variabilis TaxID=179855 RepID=A0A9P6EKN6_9AGAR|nr:enhancer of polycomb-like-domain-containing protein [Crepidotus variabilis]